MQNDRTLATLLALPLGFAAAAASAQELTKEELATRLNGIAVEDITDAPIPGLYEVAVGANVAYVTKDGTVHHPRRHLRRRDERQRQRGDARPRSRRRCSTASTRPA